MAPIGNTSWVSDLRWESYALKQAEQVKSHARAKKVVHTFAWNPLYMYVIHFAKITYFHFTRVCKRSFKKAASPEIMLFVNIKSLITVISLILYNKLGGHS